MFDEFSLNSDFVILGHLYVCQPRAVPLLCPEGRGHCPCVGLPAGSLSAPLGFLLSVSTAVIKQQTTVYGPVGTGFGHLGYLK